MSWPLLVVLGAVAAIWLRWRYRHRRMLAMAQKIPGPPPLPMLGNALQFMCQPDDFIRVIKNLMQEYGDVVRFWLGPDLNVMVSDPDDLKALLTNMKTSFKGPQYKYMADMIGDGILSGSGPLWRKHRKIATPNYGKRAIESYSEVFNQEVELLLASIRTKIGRQLNVYQYIVQTTSYAVCRTLMGLSREQSLKLPHLQDIIDDSPRMYDIVFKRMTKWYLQIDPVFWLTHLHRAQKSFLVKLSEFGKAIIAHRIDHLKTLEDQKKTDLMSAQEDQSTNTQLSVVDRFILSRDLNEPDMLDEIFTIFTSSQEASAKIASFTLLMMAYHPQCQDKFYAELKSVMGEEHRPVTDEDLKKMPYLDMVFREVVRLFPIGALLQRTIPEDIVISSGTLPAGCSLVIPIYHLHRDPRFWSKPEDFDPERFSPENTKKRHPYCYIPFSLGPMDCLGRYFGTKLVKTICARVLLQYRVTSLETYKDLKLAIAVSVMSLEGYKMILTPRSAN